MRNLSAGSFGLFAVCIIAAAGTLRSQTLPGNEPRQHGVCGSPVFSNPKIIPQAISNTERLYPKTYRLMEERAKETISTVAQDTLGMTQQFFVYNFVSQSFQAVSAILMSKGTLTEIWVDKAELANGHVDSSVVSSIDTTLSRQYGYSYPIAVRPTPSQTFGDPNICFAQDTTVGMAVNYLDFPSGDSLIVSYNSSGLNISAIESGVKSNVQSLSSAQTFYEPKFGSTYKDVTIALLNLASSGIGARRRKRSNFPIFAGQRFLFDNSADNRSVLRYII